MREMGTVELLTREGEIVIAKRIEEGLREVMHAVAYLPGTVQNILDAYEQSQTEEGRLSDLLIGYIDPDDSDVPVGPAASSKSDDEEDIEDEEEAESGPDPEEARLRFTRLKELHDAVLAAAELKGVGSAEYQTAQAAMADYFAPIKLTPKNFDAMVALVRNSMDEIRKQER